MGDPSTEEYDELHERMSSLGFKRSVKGSKRTVNLPHGLYYGSSNQSVRLVRNSISSMAQQIQPKVKVFIAQTDGWSSFG